MDDSDLEEAAVGNGLSREIIRQEIERSLRHLGTDHVDLYYAHKDHRADPLEETLSVLDELRREGKVRHIGCSNYRAFRIQEAREISRRLGLAAYCCVQQRHTYLRPVPGASLGPQKTLGENHILIPVSVTPSTK